MESGLLSSESEIQDSGLPSARVAKYHYVVSPTGPLPLLGGSQSAETQHDLWSSWSKQGRASMTVMLPKAAPQNAENSRGRGDAYRNRQVSQDKRVFMERSHLL